MAKQAIPHRSKYQGLRQILRFNWPYYVAGLITSLAMVSLIFFLDLPLWASILGWVGIFLSLTWILLSIWVSHYIYDLSDLYRFKWVTELLQPSLKSFANIHSGFDETSEFLTAVFPNSEMTVLNIYQPDIMTESSIERARRASNSPIPSRSVHIDNLNLEYHKWDAVFLILSAHEIRDRKKRNEFFKNISETLRPEGKILLVEHLRDFYNFLAFGPGFYHFLTKRDWIQAFRHANLRIIREFKITPFIQVFLTEKAIQN